MLLNMCKSNSILVLNCRCGDDKYSGSMTFSNQPAIDFAIVWELSGRVLDSGLRGCGAGLSLSGVTALCLKARHINPSLVLVQPRKTRPKITEKILIGT